MKKGKLENVMLNRHPAEVTRDRFVIEMNMPTEYPPIKARRTEDGGVRDRFFASVAELPNEVTVIHPFNVDAFEGSNERTLYVAVDGDDAAVGTKEAPLASLKEALSRLSGKKGGKIVLRGGYYNMTETLNITSEHSGSVESPLIITAEAGETPVLTTSKPIPVSAFVKSPDDEVMSLIPEEARKHIYCADLKACGIDDLGSVETAKLLINGAEGDLARYPNLDDKLFYVPKRIISNGWDDEKGCPGGDWEFGMDDDRPYTWSCYDDVYIYGALCHDWVRKYRKLSALNREQRTIRSMGHNEDAPVSPGEFNTFFFINVPEELDAPGEWYLDRKTGKLYVYPTEGVLTDRDDIRFIIKTEDVLHCTGAENVIIDRIELGRCFETAIEVKNCRQVLVQRCRVCGTLGHVGSRSAVIIQDGFRNGIIDTVLEHFSTHGAVTLGGGDRANVIPCNNFVQNCKFVNSRFRMGVLSSGVANIISHNYLHNTTFCDSGHNEGIIEYNIIEGGDTEAHDTGMIYVGGGGCSTCGNHYRYNYFFDFATGDYGIYFDDLSRGMYAYGNIIVGNGTIDDGRNWVSGGRSFNHHNGCEHCYWNNISIDAGYFAFGGDISYWMSDGAWGLFEGIYGASQEMAKERYLGRYPTYRDYVEAINEYVELRKDPDYEPKSSFAERRIRSPFANHYENNLIFRAARPYKFDNGIETATGLETNYITNEDPGFVDLEKRDYRFKPDAEVFRKIPGFIAPPFERMGPMDDPAEE